MDQIFDRREQILKYIQPYMKGCFQRSCSLIQAKLEYYANEIWEELRSKINECLNHASVIQKQQNKGKLQYLVFSFLQCGVYLECLELRIELLDDCFYLDEEEAAVYYCPSFLQEEYVKDQNFLQKKAGEKFVRLQNYERVDLKREYSGFYQSILFRMIESLTEMILELIADYMIFVEEDFKIIFGEYMGNAIILYEGVPHK